MSKFLKKALISSLSVSLLGLAWGCGSTTNNDQGASVQNLGYYVIGSTEDPPPGVTGAVIPLSSDVALDTTANDFFPGQGSATDTGARIDGLMHWASIGVFNRMQDQFIRIVRVECSYDVPGASPSLSIPDDSENVSFIVNASIYSADNPLGPVAEDAADELPNFVYAPFEILSPDLYAFLNANRSSLPALPFRMTATCRAVGVTQAGDTIATNDMPYQIQFVEFTECCGSFLDTSGNIIPGYNNAFGVGGTTAGSIVNGSSGASSGALTTNTDSSSADDTTAADAGTAS